MSKPMLSQDELSEIAGAILAKIQPQLTALEDQNKRIMRTQDTQAKRMDILDRDFSLIDDLTVKIQDLSSRFLSIEETFRSHTTQQKNSVKDIQNEVSEVASKIDSSDDAKKQMSQEVENTINKKFSDLVKVVKNADVTVKTSWFGKVKTFMIKTKGGKKSG